MGWFLVNIVVPVLAPLCVSLILYCLPLPRSHKKLLSPLRAIKDGQLCWIALAFSAAGIYELYGRTDAPWLLGLLMVTLVASSLLASAGALFQTSIALQPNEQWAQHFRCLLSSIVLTVASATCFTVAHFDQEVR